MPPSLAQEPEFFTRKCNYDPVNCDPGVQKAYLTKALMQQQAVDTHIGAATFEASTHYAKVGRRGACAHWKWSDQLGRMPVALARTDHRCLGHSPPAGLRA